MGKLFHHSIFRQYRSVSQTSRRFREILQTSVSVWLRSSDSEPASPKICQNIICFSFIFFDWLSFRFYRIFFLPKRHYFRILWPLYFCRIFPRFASNQKYQHRCNGDYFYLYSNVFVWLRFSKILDFTQYFPPKT